MTANATSTTSFILDAGGISSVDIANQLSIVSGASLEVDASAFTPGPTTVTLAEYATLANANEFTESIIAPTGFIADVVYNGTSLDLVFTAIPEPSSMILLGLILAGMFCCYRRRRLSPA